MDPLRLEEKYTVGFKGVVKKGLFSGLNPTRWIGLGHLSDNAKTIKKIANGLVKTAKVDQSSSSYKPKNFEEAMQHYGLTEESLKKRMRSALQIVVVCLSLSALMIAYMIYLFSKDLPLASFVCIMLTLLLWSYAFREHFNYFQMKQRRLGCTFKQWLFWMIKGKK